MNKSKSQTVILMNIALLQHTRMTDDANFYFFKYM